MVLYSFRRCPYAMRARMGILEAGLEVELREVHLRDKPAELVACSPKATVPVLVLPDGTVLDESLDILLWAVPADHPWRASWDPGRVAENDGPLKFHLDRAKYANRHPDEDPAEHRDAAARILRSWALDADAEPGLTDVAVFPFVRQLAGHDPGWFAGLGLTGVERWLDRWSRSALFERAMVKVPPWVAGQPPVFLSARP